MEKVINSKVEKKSWKNLVQIPDEKGRHTSYNYAVMGGQNMAQTLKRF